MSDPIRPRAVANSDTKEKARTRRSWLREPKSAIWIVLAAIVLIGGGRRLLWAWKARRAVGRLSEPDITPIDIEAAAAFGREGAWELLRIFSTTESEPLRTAAGRALARLWKDDELVAEEEQALVRRGFQAHWNARRRYPRELAAEIPIVVTYEVPFLPDDSKFVRAEDLEWSHRIVGARRAALEEFSPWSPGRGISAFAIIPGDFPTNGPHRLVLQTRVRTSGLSDVWEFELPHVPFTFDFDPVLRLDAILTLPDAARDEAMAKAIRLEPSASDASTPPRLLPIGGEWVLRAPPRLAVATPMPADLSHRLVVEFEGIAGRFPAGAVVVSGQGVSGASAATRHLDIGPIDPTSNLTIDRPGPRRMRLYLDADPQLGWADPGVRSVWPGQAVTDWVEVEILRR